MNRKALFFDVDGTLIGRERQIPESAKAAIQAARRNGHLVFINSGRVFSQLDEIRAEIDMDGYLCGCGTYVRIDDEVLYHHQIPLERGAIIKQQIVTCGFDGILEGNNGIQIRKEPSHIAQAEIFRQKLIGQRYPVLMGWEDHHCAFDKMCLIGDANSDRETLFHDLQTDFEVIDRKADFYECVPSGHSKATAIDLILDRFQIPLEQAFVFGDSMNDLSMFQHVPNAILMQDHDAELRIHSSFLTKSVEEDGIAYAMQQLALI